MEIKVEPKKVAIAFLWVAAVLTVINSVLLFLSFYLGDDELFGLLDFFDLDIEGERSQPLFRGGGAVLLGVTCADHACELASV